MQEITVTINADRTGSVSGYLGGLTKEVYRLNGPIADGVKAVLLTPDGRTLAVSDAAVGGAVEMDTDTQEVADLLRYQPVGAEAAVHIAIGSPDDLVAIVPATLRKNWLDDEATHPPVPAARYPTKAELEAWLAAADATREETVAAKNAADEAAALAGRHAADAGLAVNAAEGQAIQAAAQADRAAQNASAAANAASNAGQEATSALDHADRAMSNASAAYSSANAAKTAKEGAEAAKAGAETAKAGAIAAQGKAEQAQQGAEAVKDDLESALAAAAAMDGRVTLLESGKGVYKDPATGKVSIYTPLAQCPDGTLKVVSNIGVACKVLPVELADNARICCSDNGDYVFLFTGVSYWGGNELWIYDKNLNRKFHIKNKLGNGGFNGQNPNADISKEIDVCGDYVYVIEEHQTAILRWRLDSPDNSNYEKRVTFDKKNGIGGMFYNQASGHICIAVIEGDYPDYIYKLCVFDADLNPVLNEDGEQVVIDITDTILNYVNSHYWWLSHRHVYGRTYVFYLTNVHGHISINTALMVANADDTLSVVRESVPVEDTDNPGKALLEKDAEGNLVIDDSSLSWIPRPVTTEGREIRFNVDLEADRGYAKWAHRCSPRFQRHRFSGNMPSTGYFMSDGIDTYMILKDGRFIDIYKYPHNQWPSSKPENNYAPNLYPARTGVTDCIRGTYYNQAIPLFSVGCQPSTFSSTSAIGLIAYAPWMPKSPLTQNFCCYEHDSKMFAGAERYVPLNLNNVCGNNASPLGATWGFFGSPVWFATYDSMINGILL